MQKYLLLPITLLLISCSTPSYQPVDQSAAKTAILELEVSDLSAQYPFFVNYLHPPKCSKAIGVYSFGYEQERLFDRAFIYR